MIPKVIFRYSFIYEETLFAPNIKGVKYDRDKYIIYVDTYIKKLNKKWSKLNNKVLNYMSKITGLKWKSKFIPCYLIKISHVHAFSLPLTIPINFKGKKIYHKNIDGFIDILVHELIHNLFIGNYKETNKYFDYLLKKK